MRDSSTIQDIINDEFASAEELIWFSKEQLNNQEANIIRIGGRGRHNQIGSKLFDFE
jgi:hypothetical protein